MKNNEQNRRDGSNISIWQSNEKINNRQKENGSVVYDVVIIGGGITGLTTAYNLQRLKKKCLVVEAHNLGFGTTGGTSAHLNTFFDATYPEIDSDFGKEASKLLADAGKRMISSIKNNIDELNINADFEYRDGYLFSQNDKETKQLRQIFNSSQAAGVTVQESDKNGVPIEFQYSIKFSEQAQFHPLQYLHGLAKGFQQLGGEIWEGVQITETTFKEGVHTAVFPEGEVKAKNLVWATHIPPGINILSLRNAPYRSYVIAAQLSNGAYPECLSYDMQEPYHYFRSHVVDGNQYLIIGGADHKTGHEDPEQAFADLEKYAREHFEISDISFRWSSQYYVPVDGLPYIGLMPGGDEGTYLATGFNGNGMIFGSLSGEIITDLITGKENELAKLLSPSRLKPVSGFSEFVKENADVAYHFVADRFGNQILDSLNSLAKGEGKIASFDGEKVAIYKNEDGKVTALDPVCTHAGCIVSWNASEKSWDCPCHGGRFDVDGCVLTGPPRDSLKKVEVSGSKIIDNAG